MIGTFSGFSLYVNSVWIFALMLLPFSVWKIHMLIDSLFQRPCVVHGFKLDDR